MKAKKNNIARQVPLCALIWGNIKKYQYTDSISDEDLSKILDVNIRTIYNYNNHPEKLSTEKIQMFIDATGITKEQLIAD